LPAPKVLEHLHGCRAMPGVVIVGECKYLDSPLVNSLQNLNPFGNARNPARLTEEGRLTVIRVIPALLLSQ
jgi:hypothetical protein